MRATSHMDIFTDSDEDDDDLGLDIIVWLRAK